MGMGIDDLLCAEYKPTKRSKLLSDESQMLPLMDLENSEAVVNFDGSYYKSEETTIEVIDNPNQRTRLDKDSLRPTHAQVLHGDERPAVGFDTLAKILLAMTTFPI